MTNVRTIVLTSIFGLLLVVYVVFFVFGGEEERVRITYRLYQPRGRFDPQHPVYGVRFEFDQPYVLRRVQVEELEETEDPSVTAAATSGAPIQEPDAEAEESAEPTIVEDRAFVLSDAELEAMASAANPEEQGGPMWALEIGEADQRQPERSLDYGQNLRGMARDPDRAARLLQPMRSYRLTVVDEEGRHGELVFQTRYFQKPMSRQEYLAQRLEQRRRQRQQQN